MNTTFEKYLDTIDKCLKPLPTSERVDIVRAMSARSADFRIFRLSKKEKMAEPICFMEWLLPERLPG